LSRRKGSKNRSTLVKELVERGAVEQDLVGLSYSELEDRAAAALAERPRPPPVEHRVLIDPNDASATVKNLNAKMTEMVEYFVPGGKDKFGHPVTVPTALRDKSRTIYMATSADAARRVVKAVLDGLYLWLRWLRQRGRIAGPGLDDVRIWVV
jgi:hypothetical protein